MKRVISCLLTVMLLLTLAMPVALAADERTSGAFTYRIKGNGTAAITGYDWANNDKKDIFIPRMLDGYTVTEIADEAFAKVSYDTNGGLETVYSRWTANSLVIPDTINSIGDKAFWGLDFETKYISIPASVQHIGSGAFSHLGGIEYFVVEEGNTTYSTIDGVLYNKKEKSLIAYPPEKTAEYSLLNPNDSPNNVYSPKKFTFTVPNGIVSIDDYAFFAIDFGSDRINREAKRCIVLPDSLTTIGDYAFAHTHYSTHFKSTSNWKYYMDRFVLPSSISEIGIGAFYFGGSWNDVDLSQTKIKEIPAFAFFSCGVGEAFKLPQELQIIGSYAFATEAWSGSFFSDSPTLVFPASLTQIQENAFSYCRQFSRITFFQFLAIAKVGRQSILENNAVWNNKFAGWSGGDWRIGIC